MIYFFYYFNKPKDMWRLPNFFSEVLFVYLYKLILKFIKRFKNKERRGE